MCVRCNNDTECWLEIGGACVDGMCDPNTERVGVIPASQDDGDLCWVNEDCKSHTCRGGLCELLDDGETCIDNRACANGSCLYGRCQLSTDAADYCGPPN
jgi:hypothetical protein